MLHGRAADFYATQPHNAERRRKLGETYKQLSHVLASSGKRRRAHHYAWQAVEHFNALVRTDDSDESLLGKAHALSNLTVREYETGRFDQSRETASEAVGLYERLLRNNHDQRHHIDLSFALCNLSQSLGHLGRFREAFHKATEACELVEADLPHETSDQSAQDSDVKSAQAYAYRVLAQRLPDAQRHLPEADEAIDVAGEFDNAIENAIKSCRLYAELNEGKPKRFDHDYAQSLAVLGCRYADDRQWDQSIEKLTNALEIYTGVAQEHQEAERPRHADALRDLAASYLGRGREKPGPDRTRDLTAGLQRADEALLHHARMSAEDQVARRTSCAITRRIKAELELELGKCNDAQQHAREAVTALREHVVDRTWKGRRNLARTYAVYGDALARCGDTKAMQQYRHAYEMLVDLNLEEPGRLRKELASLKKKLEGSWRVPQSSD